MSQLEATESLISSLNFMNHEPDNLLMCFYEAESHARDLAKRIDAILNATSGWPEAQRIVDIVEGKP